MKRRTDTGKPTTHKIQIQSEALHTQPGFSSIPQLQKEQRTQEEKHSTPFSTALRTILQGNRGEILRVASDLDVSENTVYRWINGEAQPRAAYIKRIPEILPDARDALLTAIHQSFKDVFIPSLPDLIEVKKDIYLHALQLLSSASDNETRFLEISQDVIQDALHTLDYKHCGLSITFARCMKPREDGVIHSLREAVVHGTHPYPDSVDSKAFLGSTTLAGTAVALQRMQTWDITESEYRTQVDIEAFERSAYALPITRGNLIAGVLIVASAEPDFFRNPSIEQVLQEYVSLLGIALSDQDFYPATLIQLRPMPPLSWQRERLSQSYLQRILDQARSARLARNEAERIVEREMELAFEKAAMQLSVFQDSTRPDAEEVGEGNPPAL